MNARFWAWVNDGWVKLTLRPDQSLEHATGGPTEEGWHYERTRWTHDRSGVHAEWAEEGCDCDGRLDRYGESYCGLDRLAFALADDGTPIPAWERGNRHQRDWTAEAAGY